jgi:hypothetical protein
MSTPVLVAIVLIAVSCAAALTRLRLADRRSVAAHHRALETMARLVAQHPAPEPAPSPEQHAGQAHVRVVTGSEPAPPALAAPRRSRPRSRAAEPVEYRSWEDVAPVEPALEAQPGPDVTAEPEPPGPALVPTVLHFDALDGRALRGADVGATDDGAPAAGPVRRPAVRRLHSPRRALPAIRRPRRGPPKRRHRAAAASLIVILVAAGTVGALLVSRDHRAPVRTPPAPVPRAAPPPPTTTATTTVKPPPAAPVLVSSGVGYSEYRLAGPATIMLTASGRCWVEIRQNGPSGPLLYEGDLLAGDSRGAPGSTWVRLGNPSYVTVQVNGVTISPPSLIAGEPYNLQFE